VRGPRRLELSVGDLTLADLYFQTMLEEVPKMTMVGEALRPELLGRLRELESFRDYEAEADAEAEARVEARGSLSRRRWVRRVRGSRDVVLG